MHLHLRQDLCLNVSKKVLASPCNNSINFYTILYFG